MAIMHTRSTMYSNANLEMKPHSSLGHGVFARKALLPGAIIFEEQPLARAGHSPFSKLDAYFALIPLERYNLMTLVGRCCCKDPTKCTETPVLRIWIVNAFGHENGSYLYFLGSNFNNACLPNAVWEITEEATLVVKVIHEVREGEEITLAYFETDGTVEKREETTQDLWKFTCDCEACKKGAEITIKMYNEWFKLEDESLQEAVVDREEVRGRHKRKVSWDEFVEVDGVLRGM